MKYQKLVDGAAEDVNPTLSNLWAQALVKYRPRHFMILNFGQRKVLYEISRWDALTCFPLIKFCKIHLRLFSISLKIKDFPLTTVTTEAVDEIETQTEIFPRNFGMYFRIWTSWRTRISYSILDNCSSHVKAKEFPTHAMKSYKGSGVYNHSF
jgi:hypothetical protein